MSQDAPTFVASATSPGLGDGVAEGRISFDHGHLQFQSPTLMLAIPLTKLKIEQDDTAGSRVCFSDPAQPDEIIWTFDLHILEAGALRQLTHTRQQIEALQGTDELKRRIKLTLWFLGGFALLALLASMLMSMLVRSLAAKVPPELERELGESAMAELQQEATFTTDPKMMARLTNAVAPLLSAVDDRTRRYRFYIMEEESPNAFALPGGQVVVTTGMLALAQSPQELDAVVAHELAHLTQRHVFREIISSAGPFLVFGVGLGAKGGVVSLLGASSQLLIQQSFSQAYELEADAVGWNYLVAAHIDPRAMITMLRKLQVVERHEPADSEPAAFSSHPPTDKRIRRLEAKWRKFKNKSAFEHVESGG